MVETAIRFAYELNLFQTFGLAVVVLLIGTVLVDKIGFLKKFLIPAPVVGGIIFAVAILIGHQTGTFAFTLNMVLKDFFMICFFTTVGFSANLTVLKKGSVGVIIFLLAATLLCVVQNLAGVGIATAFGENPLLGLATGSIPMTGGHGTAGSFGPVLEEYGLLGGSTVAIAAATFGLVSGSLIGGPTARRIISNKGLKSGENSDDYALSGVDAATGENQGRLLDTHRLANGFYQIAIAVGIGSFVSLLIAKTGLVVPAYVGSMLVAAVMTNVLKPGTKTEIQLPEITALGNVFLSVFLAYALMDLRLWELTDLALPLITILLVQVAIMFFYATFITFPLMGGDYDAAVLAAGHCGFGLGATPNGVANMTAVTQAYGPSTKAFFILPIVGGLFIDFTNTAVITVFLNFLSK